MNALSFKLGPQTSGSKIDGFATTKLLVAWRAPSAGSPRHRAAITARSATRASSGRRRCASASRTTNLESLVVASSEDTARELKEVKEELKGLKDTARALKEGMRALLQAQGIPAERLPLTMDDLSA